MFECGETMTANGNKGVGVMSGLGGHDGMRMEGTENLITRDGG